METDAQGEAIRRVAVGEDATGAPRVAEDANVLPVKTPLLPGAKFYSLWGADAVPRLPNDGAEPSFRAWFPPAGGFRFELIVLPPAQHRAEGPPAADRDEALAETEKRLPGLIAAMDPHHPGMHRTDTIDLIYVTEGACVLDFGEADLSEANLGEANEIALAQGDAVVLNGCRHAWRNPHKDPCGLLTVSLGIAREA